MSDRILLVEDDPAILRGLTDNFRAEAYDLALAPGVSALLLADVAGKGMRQSRQVTLPVRPGDWLLTYSVTLIVTRVQ